VQSHQPRIFRKKKEQLSHQRRGEKTMQHAYFIDAHQLYRFRHTLSPASTPPTGYTLTQQASNHLFIHHHESNKHSLRTNYYITTHHTATQIKKKDSCKNKATRRQFIKLSTRIVCSQHNRQLFMTVVATIFKSNWEEHRQKEEEGSSISI
jgi:hypothetical protein